MKTKNYIYFVLLLLFLLLGCGMCQGGNNLQNLIAITEAENGFFEHTRIGVIHWNGNKVSKEFELGFTGWGPFVEDMLFMINQDNFLVMEPGANLNNPAKLYYGTKK